MSKMVVWVFSPSSVQPHIQEQSPSVLHPGTAPTLTLCPQGPLILAEHSHTLSLMVFTVLTPAPGKVTLQVRVEPWFWGPGVRVTTEELKVLEPREVTLTPIQEIFGGVPLSQAHGTEQVMFLGCPDSRNP